MPNHELVDVDGVISIHVQDIKQRPSLAPRFREPSGIDAMPKIVPNSPNQKLNKENQRGTLNLGRNSKEAKSVHLRLHGTYSNLRKCPQCLKPKQ